MPRTGLPALAPGLVPALTWVAEIPTLPPAMLNPRVRMYLAAFMVDAAVMVALLALPFFVYRQLGGGVAMSGTFGALQMASYATVCIVTSRFVSRAKNGLHWALAGIVIFSAMICLMPLFRNAWLCGGIAVVAFGAQAFIWPSLHSWVGAEPDPRARTRHMVWFNCAWSAGFTLSPLLAGPLVDYDYRLSFVLLFVMGVAGFLLVASLPHERLHYGEATPAILAARADHDRASEAYLYCAWCATFVANILVAVTRMVYPKRVEELVASGQLRLLVEKIPADFLTTAAATKYSWLAMGLSFATVLSFVVLGVTSGWRHRYQVLFLVQAAAGAAFWELGRTSSMLVMMLCFAVIGANSGLAFFSSTYYSLSDPAHKHRRATINEALVGSGGFLGSIVFGSVAAYWSFEIPFHYSPALIALALAVQIVLLRYGKRRAQTL